MRSLVLVLGAGIFAIVPGYAQDAASGEKIFLQCKACHQIGENAKNAIGPVLNGLFGRKAGMIEGYSYSPANKNSGITWDEATFKEMLSDRDQSAPEGQGGSAAAPVPSSNPPPAQPAASTKATHKTGT